ncbi:uncharacterized protein G2W53_034210 [Senna tora]|uniref:Uncharacterized protein n=1 Tax=Senna tora TaxID=362788 RepID=A0A834SZX0_9FABA|nr:uncharacterized protein G2W53_034210 [Senna tora]
MTKATRPRRSQNTPNLTEAKQAQIQA